MIKQLEQISMNAWPALQTKHYDGWIMRFANGVTRRSNSVYPLFESTIPVEDKVKYCENFYTPKSLPTLFKMTSNVFPSDLDSILASKGYKRDADASVQIISVRNTTNFDRRIIHLNSQYDPKWIERFVKFNRYDPSNIKGYDEIIKQISFKRIFLDLIIDNQYAGCGLGVVEDKFLGIFDIVVNPDNRRNGFGKMIVESLLSWGKDNGAETAYLQVMLDNDPALNLYRKMGFKETYKYWYRVK